MNPSQPHDRAAAKTTRRRNRTPKLSWAKRLERLGVLGYFTLMRRTVRIRVTNDRRDEICHQSDRQFVYALLHAHQAAAIALSDPNTGALVSRSRDGELLVPLLKSCGCVPIRGSSGGSKGGATALTQMIRHCQDGHPAVIAVDGPKGPRGKVQKGVAKLAQKADIPIVPVVLVPKRRFLFAKAWDRMQLPWPFTQLDCRFGDPISVAADDDLDDVASRLEVELAKLELAADPQEAERSQEKSSIELPADATGLNRAA
ncbi:DUF374 domain-containing protein [Allorhodopirellula solitaria]|uniref:DUF374 domain-containing protein n=1 Tax=Allorhodopirellula solitaria TaxID=2527987 RepID=A0A5C5X1W5_9BACT|nr:DUF374 domain-containing protein [Allorhodopirellula solitaria]TWT56155.1 hypothetical protein CA85_44970 [Allorhodopirellula solitaria]